MVGGPTFPDTAQGHGAMSRPGTKVEVRTTTLGYTAAMTTPPTPPPTTPLSPELAPLIDRQLILTCTTGRSGTGFLAAALTMVPGLVSTHEPKPWLAEVLRDVQTDPDLARRFLLERKLPEWANITTRSYAETSHLYCKGFFEPLFDLGLRPDLVILHRPPRQVACSMLRLDTVPGRTAQGLRWYLSPDDPGVLPLPGWRELDDYQLCYWYCLEIARRAEHYDTLFRHHGARVSRIELAEVRTVGGFRRLLRELALPSLRPFDWLRLALNRYTRVNTKKREKAGEAGREIPHHLDTLEHQVHRRLR